MLTASTKISAGRARDEPQHEPRHEDLGHRRRRRVGHGGDQRRGTGGGHGSDGGGHGGRRGSDGGHQRHPGQRRSEQHQRHPVHRRECTGTTAVATAPAKYPR
ncbi:hypothetical protein BBK82_32985 [Lentzea guizhouensis]|uniref:Uncharacterized protein n=1 Tax=Lentzea guizhouensis TaxID=1586287 RepID=A0A1B2HQX9_9PSEU|nr:hypothetical protein BBK82_32985 [Lentzea guizhouensis]